MNRLHHIRITLPANLKQNPSPRVKFVVLDYGSTDGLCEYISENLSSYLRSGQLSVFRYPQARYFHHSHARNLGARCCDTEFVCNLDGDNFIGPGFGEYLLDIFSRDPECYVTGLDNPFGIKDAFGRFALSKNNYLSVGGYDEDFHGYGYEDYDLSERLERKGCRKIIIDNAAYLQTLTHPNTERVSNVWYTRHLAALYVQHLDPLTRIMMFVFDDGTLHYGLVKQDPQAAAGNRYRFMLAGGKWQHGKWQQADGGMQVSFESFHCSFQHVADGMNEWLLGHQHALRREDQQRLITEALQFHTEIANRYRLYQNRERKATAVNAHGAGLGLAFLYPANS